MGKLLPVLLAVIGICVGVGSGLMLKPEPHMPDIAANPCGEDPNHALAKAKHEPEEEDIPSDREYVKLNNQFVVPVVVNEKVSSLVLLTISIEITTGQKEAVFAKEPKLRDGFLQVMFDHANVGGFDGTFTSSNNMDILRAALKEVAVATMGSMVTDVLITDANRQDVS